MNVSEWFEKKYLEYQMKNGRISITKFAKILGISPSYLSQLMTGKNKGLSYETASQLCSFFDDWSLFDILGFSKPTFVDGLSAGFKYKLEEATEEVNRTLRDRGITGEMPEAELIAIEIFERFGFKYINTEES